MSEFPTIREILKRPYFQGATVHASEKALDREVEWVHILEVTDVGELLNGNELILSTGLSWKDGDEAGVSFLRQIMASRASGLCLETGRVIDRIPEQMLQLAKRNDFPIIIFHPDRHVRYIEITRDIHTWIINRQRGSFFQENRWTHKWLNGEIEEAEIRRRLLTAKPGLKLGLNMAVVFELEAAKLHTPDFETRCIQKNMTARHVFESEGFYLIPTIADTHLVYILLDLETRPDIDAAAARALSRFLQADKRQPPEFVKFAGAGRSFRALTDLQDSYRTALDVIGIQKDIGPLPNPFDRDLHLYRILYKLRESGELPKLVRDRLGPLLQADNERRDLWIKTLKTYFEQNLAKRETAEALFISRQTLYARLEKIAELLGGDFHAPGQRLALELAVCGYEYLRRSGSSEIM
ncbi:PucR family transcriptional regulator [Paenibacillus thermoaerophilus]|uniref:PucR family transcriptional regulator n=1 Tax=Paenibacillus thermoaerophilus TaxID=1215385 RepID=A0ABW2V6M3_9BACL|nr:PucR family transcriptional regulator [Paenibacillus thermoaerophilus]TMV18510.1 hypothetical protein FE781_03605 [Paenibacillus thermoaerophilus]